MAAHGNLPRRQAIRFLLVICLLVPGTVQAASLVTLQLHNRPATEVIPIIEPMLAPGDVITGHGYKIFLRASAQTVADVKAMLEALDNAPKMLRISVFQGSRQSLKRLDISGSLRIDGSDGGVSIGNPDSSGAGSIDYSSGDTRAGVDATRQNQDREGGPLHQVRVAEGNEAFIQTGARVPYYGGDDGTVLQNVTTGFYVLPRIHGNRVTLEVRPFKNSLSKSHSGTIDTQSANTTLHGGIGKWLQVGGVSEHSSYTQSGNATYSSGSSNREDSIWIRADLLR